MGSLVYPSNAQPVFASRAYAAPELVPHPLGTRGRDVFGREYRFGRAGGTALVAGNALQGQAQIAHHQDMTPTAAAIGARSISVTPGATGGAADLYAGGVAVIDTTPGEGYSYPIKQHDAITASVAFTVNLQAGWEVQVALTTSSRVSLYANPWRNVINSPTTLTGVVAAVAQFPTVASEYGWFGVRGLFGTQIDGTPAVGTPVGVPSTAAGAVGVVAGTDAAVPNMPVGAIADTGQDGKWEGVEWIL